MTDDNHALQAKVAQLEAQLTGAPGAPPPQGIPTWVKVAFAVLGVAVLVAIALLLLNRNSDDDESIATSGLTEQQIFDLQQECFQNVPPLFFDEVGNCYSQDPTGLNEAQRAAILVARPLADGAATTTVAAGDGSTAAPGAPAAPAAPSNPAAPQAPVAPAAPTTVTGAAAPVTTTATPAAPTTTAATPAAPTTAPTAPTTAPTATTAPPTTAAPAGLTFGNPGSAWDVALAPPPPVGYSTVTECQNEDPRSAACNAYFDLSKNVTIYIGLVNGSANGSARNIVTEGTMVLGERTTLVAQLSNASGVQSEYFFSGTAGPGCTFSGSYSHLFSRPANSSDVGPRSPANPDSLFPTQGNFNMRYQGNDCPN